MYVAYALYNSSGKFATIWRLRMAGNSTRENSRVGIPYWVTRVRIPRWEFPKEPRLVPKFPGRFPILSLLTHEFQGGDSLLNHPSRANSWVGNPYWVTSKRRTREFSCKMPVIVVLFWPKPKSVDKFPLNYPPNIVKVRSVVQTDMTS